ncbi:transcription factor MYB101-like [Senna tora]|uniref:Transcription factor MYB101-like n=1 Tax=Senna tora TaxID=362788 RepID=A0A834WKZ1_9FABA|nr:transcription factor MYB101-like [Senna tora]
MEEERMRKGPWTSREDAILTEYVKKHGEGNWNNVQYNSPLARCGKSCRLRWANHLRPNLKKGAFSPFEQSAIIYLHAKLGNKWARMASFVYLFLCFILFIYFSASQLPGRTDNEIKNFWNTRLKRCLKAGSPLYPPISPLVITQLKFSNLQGQSVPMFSSHVSPYAPSSSSTTLPNDHPLPAPLPSNFVFGLNDQNLSNQTPFGFMASSDSTAANNDYSGYEAPPPLMESNSSGLLEDLVLEAQALSHNHKSKTQSEAIIDKEQHNINVGMDHFPILPFSTEAGKDADGETNALSMEKKDDGDLFSMVSNFTSQLPKEIESEAAAGASWEPTDEEFGWAMGNCWDDDDNIPGMF